VAAADARKRLAIVHNGLAIQGSERNGNAFCHRAEQNRPEVSDSKPATLKQGIHIISGFSIKGFPVRVKTSRTG